MRKRIKLSQRQLPPYTKGEEIMNMVTHISGGALAIAVLVLCVIRAAHTGAALAVTGCAIYGSSMVALYAVSSIYHGLPHGTAKKVMQVIDHCTIYFLIVGTYTAVLTCVLIPTYPSLGWTVLGIQWGFAILATTLNAIDLDKYSVLSMILYICMGWGIAPFLGLIYDSMTPGGFWLLLCGGIAYTLGAVLYGIGNKRPWFHSVFHIFVVAGSVLQFFAIFFYAL